MNYDGLFEHADVVAVGVLMALLVVPVAFYLFTGWSIRRAEIVGAMSAKGADLYFRQFYPALMPTRDGLNAFRKHYARRYSRRHYVIPLLLLSVVAAFLLLMTTRTLLHWQLGTPHKADLPPIAIAATAGAYMWVVWDELGRCRKRQLAPIDLYRASLRFIVAIPVAFALSGVLRDEAAVGVAFLLGSFPTDTLFTISRRIANRKLGLSEGGEKAESEVERLQEITQGLGERFRDEGVSTILQLAYADPVDLAILTSSPLRVRHRLCEPGTGLDLPGEGPGENAEVVTARRPRDQPESGVNIRSWWQRTRWSRVSCRRSGGVSESYRFGSFGSQA